MWGVHPVRTEQIDHVSDMVAYGCDAALRDGFAGPGDIVAIAAGMPVGTPGTTNLLRIARVEAAGGAPDPEVPAQAAEAWPTAPPIPAGVAG